MSEPQNHTITALTEEITRREKELAVLRAARDLVQLAIDARVTVTATMAPSNGNGNGPSRPTAAKNGRAGTARLLAEFNRKEVATIEAATKRAGMTVRQAGIGVLVRHGYLKPKGGGYVRTRKEFYP